MQGHKQEADAVTSIEPVNKCCSCCVYALIDYAYLSTIMVYVVNLCIVDAISGSFHVDCMNILSTHHYKL